MLALSNNSHGFDLYTSTKLHITPWILDIPYHHRAKPVCFSPLMTILSQNVANYKKASKYGKKMLLEM